MNIKSLPNTNNDAGNEPTIARISTLQPTLLLFLILFPLSFMHLILHEGGHALVHLLLKGKVDVFYAHPFALDGYVRPFLSTNNLWNHAAGSIAEFLVPLSLFILIWKRRSVKILPLVLLFPWCVIRAGLGIMDLAAKTGDFNNIIKLTGMSPAYFYVLDFLLLMVGIFLFISLFPLLGLAPENRRSLFAMPVGLFLWSFVGVMVAYLTVPGSPIDVRYHLGASLISSVKIYPIFSVILGSLLAVIYIIFYHRVYQKLPTGIRTETVDLTWKDLYIPGWLAVISIVIGLILSLSQCRLFNLNAMPIKKVRTKRV